MKILIFFLIPFLGLAQTINIIGVNDQNTKITRFEKSTIELEKCSIYNYYNVTENIEPTGLEISAKSKDGNVIYYLVNLDKKVGMMMIMNANDICRVTSWYDGIELNKFIESKY
jgi:hypothetical protein